MHGLKPCPALAAAISELSTAIAFALSTVSSSTVRALGGSGWVTQSPSLRYTFMRRMGRYKDFLPVSRKRQEISQCPSIKPSTPLMLCPW